ncbi:uncharacterized protein [Nicotiana sylvestris]|uniref:uncharacterized protein n=1 Tax=Nicotiana sylvestris TaxID=4096 RepID=UPI00388CB1A2
MADGTVRYQGRLCVPDIDGPRKRIMAESHTSKYSVQPGSTKMYHDLREVYWWNNMKKDVAEFGAKCQNCQQVKAEHQRPGGLAQSIEIPMWKWEMINMDFMVVGDPTTVVPVENIEVNEELSYDEVLVAVLGSHVRKLKKKEIASVKVLWRNHQVEEATWEVEEEMIKKYPHLFVDRPRYKGNSGKIFGNLGS